MTLTVLPDDSLVVTHGAQVIHFCTKSRGIHLRAHSPRSPTGGSLLATYPLNAASRVRLTTVEGRTRLVLELKSGDRLDLGGSPTQDVAMVTARLISELTRCSIEFGEGRSEPLQGRAQSEVQRTERALAPPHFEEAPTPVDADPPPRGETPTLRPTSIRPAEPVFLQLLMESSVEAARSPGVDILGPGPSPSSAERRAALYELLGLASERLPVADQRLSAPPRPESQS